MVKLILVSVPWRGLRSFGLPSSRPEAWRSSGFPSPGGGYGLSDLHGHHRDEPACLWFPSPGGDYGLSDKVPLLSRGTCSASFRPLAGITVFRTFATMQSQMRLMHVSVPWRGLRSFGRTAACRRRRPPPRFPSPGGDYGLSDSDKSRFTADIRPGVSVPWRGLRSFGPKTMKVTLGKGICHNLRSL